jgi:hypothetical protein
MPTLLPVRFTVIGCYGLLLLNALPEISLSPCDINLLKPAAVVSSCSTGLAR